MDPLNLPGDVVVRQGQDNSPDARLGSVSLKFTDAENVEHSITGPISIEGRLEDINMVATEIFRNLHGVSLGKYTEATTVMFENVRLIEKDEEGNTIKELDFLDFFENLKPTKPEDSLVQHDSGYQSNTINDYGRPRPNISIIEAPSIEEETSFEQPNEVRASGSTTAPRETDHRVADYNRLINLSNEYYLLSEDLLLLEEQKQYLETINEPHAGKIVRKIPEKERQESLPGIEPLKSNISKQLEIVSSRLNKLDSTGTIINDIKTTIQLKNRFNSETNKNEKAAIFSEIQQTQERILQSLYEAAKLDTEPKDIIDLSPNLSKKLTKNQNLLKENMKELLEGSKNYREASRYPNRLEYSHDVYELEMRTRAYAHNQVGAFWRGIKNKEEYRQLLSDMFPNENIDKILIAPGSFLQTSQEKIEKLLNEPSINEKQFDEILDLLMLVAGISNYASVSKEPNETDNLHSQVLVLCDYSVKKREHIKKKATTKEPSLLEEIGKQFWGEGVGKQKSSKDPSPKKFDTNDFLRNLVLNVFDDFSIREKNYDRLNIHTKK